MLSQDHKTSNKTERYFQHKSSVKSARKISPFVGTPMHLEAHSYLMGPLCRPNGQTRFEQQSLIRQLQFSEILGVGGLAFLGWFDFAN
jgi:hypothetical protein